MRVIVACAGSQKKWGNYLGVPSHFAPVRTGRHEQNRREPLLLRTLHQLQKYATDVHLTAPPDDERYQLPGVTVHTVDGESEFHSTRHLWAEDDRTVLLLGDVYFSDLGIRRIMNFPYREYRAFGRPGASRVTGTPYGEIFANSWWPEQHADIDSHLKRVEVGRQQGILRPHGWMLLRSFEGVKLNRHIVDRKFFEVIDDWTDDIDFPEDFERHPATKGYNP